VRYDGFTEEIEVLVALLQEQRKTNALLEHLLSPKKSEYDDLKRPELMKLMKERKDAPTGWNKWGNDKMIAFLKGE
jgi:hypothetical protein